MDELLGEFLAESFDKLSTLQVALVALERNPDDAAGLAGIFRTLHGIKGACGFLGLARLERVAHATEDVLARLRDGAIPVSAETVSLLRRALDRIAWILTRLQASEVEPPGDDAALTAALARVAAGGRAEPAGLAPAFDAPRLGGSGSDHGAAGSRSVRVPVDLLEELTTRVGELALTRDQLVQAVRGAAESPLEASLRRLNRITTELQEGVRHARLEPIGAAWAKLPRLVRALGHELDKSIALELAGAETALDRRVLALLEEPLVHLVRNAADHGIEPAAERRRAGKPEAGTVRVSAAHDGDRIVVEVDDDGRGLDPDTIAATALAQGLATGAELAALSAPELLRLVFRPGFSTARRVSAVSGRGVGMDVVRTNVERAGGRVALGSQPGRGTTVTITLPMPPAVVAAPRGRVPRAEPRASTGRRPASAPCARVPAS